MFRYIQVRNFSSIKDSVRIDFEVPKKYYKEQDGNHVISVELADGRSIKLYKQMVFFGLNSSGKTNILRAIASVHLFLVDSFKNQKPESPIGIWNPYLFVDHPDETTSDYESVFFIDGIQYQYRIEFNEQFVVSEELYYWPSGKINALYKRSTSASGKVSIQWGAKYAGLQRKNIEDATKANVPLLTTAAFLNDEVILPIYRFFKNQRKTISDVHRSENPYGIIKCDQDPVFKSSLLIALSQADFLSISDIDIQKKELNENDVPPELLSILKKENEPLTMTSAYLVHKVGNIQFPLSIRVESEGTKSFAQLFYRLYYTIKNNSLDLIDEIESSLHSGLVEYLLTFFARRSNEAQMVFTTHNISLLDDSEHIKRGEIVFVGRDEKGATITRRLSDYPHIRSNSKIEQMYRRGDFGAYPRVKF